MYRKGNKDNQTNDLSQETLLRRGNSEAGLLGQPKKYFLSAYDMNPV